MTEAEWVACVDPAAMLEYLMPLGLQRKLRLFAVACCHNILPMLTDVRSRDAVEFAESFSEGCIPQRARRAVYALVSSYAGDFAPDEAAAACVHRLTPYAAGEAARWSAVAVGAAADASSSDVDHVVHGHRKRDREKNRQAHLLRDIIGNPFRPAAFDPAWRTSTVLALAASIYESRSFHDLPVLADALEDAHCTDESLLGHLRGGGVHARGCWALDLRLDEG